MNDKGEKFQLMYIQKKSMSVVCHIHEVLICELKNSGANVKDWPSEYLIMKRERKKLI